MKKVCVLIVYLSIFCLNSSIAQSLTAADALTYAKQVAKSQELVTLTDNLRQKNFILSSISHVKFGTAPNIKYTDTYFFENVSNLNEKIVFTTNNGGFFTVTTALQTNDFTQYLNWFNDIKNNRDFRELPEKNTNPILKVFNYKPGVESIYSRIEFTTVAERNNAIEWSIKRPITYTMTLHEINK